MAWYQISMDELEHNEQMKKTYVDDPREKSVRMIDMMLTRVLSQLGVDTSVSDDEIKDQQLHMEIDITEMTEDQLMYLCQRTRKTFNPKALGFYVYQYGEPVCFISDPYIKGNMVTVNCEPYDSRIRFDERQMKLVGRG